MSWRKYRERYVGRIFRLGPKAIIKIGPPLSEAQAMDFVAKNTNIPVPRILSVFTAKGEVHIVMEYIRAPLLRDCWEVMSWEQRKSIVVQLRDFILQLRALTPLHPGKIHAAGGAEFELYDPRQQNKPFGPFETVDQFHEFTGVNYLRQHIDEYPTFQSAFEKCAECTYGTKFSHGDLAPHNVMVQDGKVVCIIDWECAGWYPEYWEYTSCFRSNDLYTSFWDMMKEEMEPYPDELEIDHCLSSVFLR
jgi:aminoglycoside phosphotransferase (APT) family kinase protein